MSTETVYFLIPEIVLLLAATGIYLGGTWVRQRTHWHWAAAGGLLLAALALVFGMPPELLGKPLKGPLSTDVLGYYGRAFALVLGLLFVMLSSRSAIGELAPEFFGSLLLLIVGLMLVSAGRELVILFLGVELITIPTYVVLYLARRSSAADSSSQEAATKYFFLSVLSAAVLLYGFSFLYGATGETDLGAIRAKLASGAVGGKLAMAQLAMVLILAGLGFKIAAVPFHFYAPDVYQGTSNQATALLAVVPKVAGFLAIARILSLSMPGLESAGWKLAWVMAAATMTLGNVMALWQDNLRRLLAYSSIAHAGYMLIGIAMSFALPAGQSGAAAVRFDPLAGTFIYVVLYSLATIGIFAGATYLGRDDRQIDGVNELAGLGRSHPTVALALAVCLFSLAGIPPLAGFWGKFFIFGSAIEAGGMLGGGPTRNWATGLAIVGVINAAIAGAYYLRLIGIMYFRPGVAKPAAQGGIGAGATMLTCVLLVVFFGCFPGPLRQATTHASHNAHAALQSPGAVVSKAEPAVSRVDTVGN